MALLNYTTSIDWRKSVGEILPILASSGVSAVMQEYDGAGIVTAICFRARTEFGEMGFRLPADVMKTKQILADEHKAKRIDRRFANDHHARNVAWRILRTWIEAQVALIQIGLVKVEQVFLPYAQNDNGETLFEALQKSRFKGLVLADRKKESP